MSELEAIKRAKVPYYSYPGLMEMKYSEGRPKEKGVRALLMDRADYDILWEIIYTDQQVNPDALQSRIRTYEYSTARQLYCAFLSIYSDLGLKRIGVQCGGRDHTTVIHSKNKVKEMAETDRRFLDILNRIDRKVVQRFNFSNSRLFQLL